MYDRGLKYTRVACYYSAIYQLLVKNVHFYDFARISRVVIADCVEYFILKLHCRYRTTNY
jgi:hypothetical protein